MPLIICNVSALPGVNTYLKSIRSSWRRSQEDNQDTDLTLVSGAISVDVHQSVLLPLSRLLLDLVTSSSSCECAKPAVTIPPVGQDALNALVDLLYVGRCRVESEQAKKRVEDLWALLRFRVPISCGGGDSREEPARNEEASMDEENSAIASTEQPITNNAEVMGPSEKKDYVQQPEDGDHSSAKVKRKRKPSKKKVDALESIDSTSKRNPPRNSTKVRHLSAQDAKCHGEDVTSNTEIMRRSNKPKVTMSGSSMPQATVVDSSTPRSEHYLQSDEPIIRGHGLPSACAPAGGMTINDVAMSTPNTTFTNQLPPSFPSPSEQKIKSTRSRQRTKRKTTEFWSTDKVTNNNFPTSDGPSETASNVDANESEDGFDVHQDCYTVLKENHESVVKETTNKLVILSEDDKEGASKVLEENGNLDTSLTVMDQVKSEMVEESSQGVTERIDTKHSVEESSQGGKERIDTKHPCLFCPKLFSSSLDLQGHLSLSHFKYEISRRYPGVICQYCKKSFVTKSGHVKHIGSVHKIIEGLLRVAGSTKLAKMKEVQMNLNGGINLKDDAH